MSSAVAEPRAERELGAPAKRRLLTGLRPTGKLHLGNYIGTLENDVRLQSLPEYTCFFLVADFHALTTSVERSAEVGENVRETLLDMLASGIHPERSTLYVQSTIP